MKERRTLDSLEVTGVCNGSPSFDGYKLHQLVKANEPWNIGDKIEIVAVKEVEPKRTLVVPEGVRWITGLAKPSVYTLVVPHYNHALAEVIECDDGIRWYSFNGVNATGGTENSIELAKQTIYEKLADLGWHGFGWKIEEPDLSRYVTFSVWARYYSIQEYPKYQEAIHRAHAISENDCCATVFVHGWNANGQVDLLETLTKEEVKNG
jgi:hypothetical protein